MTSFIDINTQIMNTKRCFEEINGYDCSEESTADKRRYLPVPLSSQADVAGIQSRPAGGHAGIRNSDPRKRHVFYFRNRHRAPPRPLE